MQDRDFSDTEWNNYLKKFASKYRVFPAKTGEDSYLGSFIGKVHIFSILKKQLLFCLDSGHPRVKTLLKQNPLLTCTQEGDQEAVFIFEESNLEKLAGVLRLKRKKHFSPDTLEKFRINAIKNLHNKDKEMIRNEGIFEQEL